jgi:hypothetical protein
LPEQKDLYPPSAVTHIVAVLRILAPALHCAPCVVFGFSRPAVSDVSGQDQFLVKASTGTSRRNLASKYSLIKRTFLTTVTPTPPSPQFLSRLNFADHDEPSVSLPNKIDHGQNCIRGHWRVSLL